MSDFSDGLQESMAMPVWSAWLILILATGTLALLVLFALHRAQLLWLARRVRTEPKGWSGPLPRVTVQLPVYNESTVVERLVDAAASLDYPRDRLEIQLLDDSTDKTSDRGARRVSYWQTRGVHIRHLRRRSREGFKAGALARGMAEAGGDFMLVLDADFVPRPDLIHRLLGPFHDPQVGMVQARWDHLNERRSLLTRSQALGLDAHFFLEQGGRWAGGRFMNFNGTAGMWRRTALEDAGGWSADTLTEDLDVSYRAQMAGWRFVFRPEVGVPAEIPESVRALETQQKRWAQGGVQTARKLLPTLLRGPWPPAVKGEAIAHLLGHLAHPLTLLLGLLLVPSALARRTLGLDHLLFLDVAAFLCATFSFIVFFCAAGRRRRRPWGSLIPTAVATLALGIGLGASVSLAVFRGAFGKMGGGFERTPKRGNGSMIYPSLGHRKDVLMKAGLTCWMGISLGVAIHQSLFTSLPFILLFGGGYAWLIWGEIKDARDAAVIPQVEHAEQKEPFAGEYTPLATS